jgi:fucose permease
MMIVALIGAKALYLLYGWLLSAIVASYLSGKKGYGERIGLASGLILTVIGVVIWIAMPAKETSDWGRRKRSRG